MIKNYKNYNNSFLLTLSSKQLPTNLSIIRSKNWMNLRSFWSLFPHTLYTLNLDNFPSWQAILVWRFWTTNFWHSSKNQPNPYSTYHRSPTQIFQISLNRLTRHSKRPISLLDHHKTWAFQWILVWDSKRPFHTWNTFVPIHLKLQLFFYNSLLDKRDKTK